VARLPDGVGLLFGRTVVGVSGSGESMVADCFGDGGDGPAELFEWFGGDHAAVYAAVWISVCVGSVALRRPI
jgi:hypothetical protein